MTREDIDALWIEANLKAEVEYQKRLTGRYYQSFVVEHFAALIEQHLIESGYRKCAEGQRTTQYCCMVEEAVKSVQDHRPNDETNSAIATLRQRLGDKP